MIHRPLISVITPVRNGRRYASTCLASIQAAEFGRAEHILCDGGSNDGTFEFCQAYGPTASTPVISVQIEDRSMTEGLNNAVRQSNGEWIMPLNIDDQYMPGIGPRIEAALESFDGDIAFFDVLVRKQGRPKYFQRPWMGRYIWAWDFMGCFVVECGVAMRRSSIDRVDLYDTTYLLAADYDLYRKLVSRGKVGYFPICIGVFNEDGENLSHTMKGKILDEAGRISKLGKLYARIQDSRVDKVMRIVLGMQSYWI